MSSFENFVPRLCAIKFLEMQIMQFYSSYKAGQRQARKKRKEKKTISKLKFYVIKC